MLYISRLVFQNISCVFPILLLAKDHFLTQYIFCTCKTVMWGRFVIFFLFLISTALSHAPHCNRDPGQVGH